MSFRFFGIIVLRFGVVEVLRSGKSLGRLRIFLCLVWIGLEDGSAYFVMFGVGGRDKLDHRGMSAYFQLADTCMLSECDKVCGGG